MAFDAQTLLVAAIAAAGVLVCAVVGMPPSGDRQWVWFGLTVMLVIAGVATGISWVRTDSSPQVRPAAMIRTNGDGGMAGLFIAETSDRLYLARVGHIGDSERGEPGTGRLVSVPLDQIAALEIGVNSTLSHALAEAPQLLSELNLCRPPAQDCESDLTSIRPGFSANSPVPVTVGTIRLLAGRRWSIDLQSTASFAISAARIRITGVRRIRRRRGRAQSQTIVLGSISPTNRVPPHNSQTVTFAAEHAEVLLGAHPMVRQVRIVATLTAPNGTTASAVAARHSTPGLFFDP